MTIAVSPSLPAQDALQLTTLLDQLQGVAKAFQVDFVDGSFAKPASWPFNQTDTTFSEALTILAPYREAFIFEADCMVEKPEQYIEALIQAGFRKIILQYSSTDAYDQIYTLASKHEIALGIAITNDVSLLALEEIMSFFSYIQVMGITTIGVQGQPFDERTLKTVAVLRAQYKDVPIVVDGAVNESTAPYLVAAGATRLAPGSAISMAPDAAVAYKHLQALVS